jgi:glycosyltransferase involved in cell wall biosynthesis
MSNIKVAIVMLTWQRLEKLPESLKMLSNQTNKNFTLYISNSNSDQISRVEELVSPFREKLIINLTHDSNEKYSFRRLLIGKDLALKGFDAVLFLDDDVLIPQNYVEQCLSYFEPNSYKSAYAWQFLEKGQNYYKGRIRVTNADARVHYCGTASSIIDSKIFLNEGILRAPVEAYPIEDLWMSYYADHILKWKLEYMPIQGITIGGNDPVALSKVVKRNRNNKAVFLRKLATLGWNLSI